MGEDAAMVRREWKTPGRKKKDPWKLQLQVVVIHPMWVVETKVWPLEEQLVLSSFYSYKTIVIVILDIWFIWWIPKILGS